MLQSTSALAISDRSLALRMRRYAGLWEPGAATMVNSTPVGHDARLSLDNFYHGRRRNESNVYMLQMTYHHPHPPHQESGQTGAQRGRSLVLATPRSPWSSRPTCRSAHRGTKQQFKKQFCFIHSDSLMTYEPF